MYFQLAFEYVLQAGRNGSCFSGSAGVGPCMLD